MKRIVIVTMTILLSGCAGSTPTQPLRYVAVDMPKTIAPSERSGPFQTTRTRFGILYRSPQDVGAFIRELHEQSHSPVLRDADVHLEIPFCVAVFCLGT